MKMGAVSEAQAGAAPATMKIAKDLRHAVKTACKRGWVLTSGAKHMKLVRPGHRDIHLPGTPSDQRSVNNTLAQMRREGALP